MNLVIITSVLDTPNTPLSYTNVRSIYTVEERYYQTLQTIDSVKEKIPNSFIVVLECSNPNNEYVKKLETNINIYKFINYYDVDQVKKKIYGKFKGIGEATFLKIFLDQNSCNHFENIFKLSGRYKLTDSFNYKNFDNMENVFKSYPDNVVTCLYKINKKYIEDFKDNILNKSLEILTDGESIENVFLDLLKNNFKNIDGKIGVIGMCSVNGAIIEH